MCPHRMEARLLRNREIYTDFVVEHMLTARRSVWIATANLKDMHVEHRRRYRSVLAFFRKLADREVDVRILHAAVPSEPYLHSLKECGLVGREHFTMRRCPRVHLKCVLVDDGWVFLGSANLTGAGMGVKSADRRTFEIGILTRDDVLRAGLTETFLEVWEGRACETCGRKRHCPVPLEEPDF